MTFEEMSFELPIPSEMSSATQQTVHAPAAVVPDLFAEWRAMNFFIVIGGFHRGRLETIAPPLNFNTSNQFLSKLQCRLRIPYFEGFRNKMKTLSTYNLMCRKFAAVCRLIVISPTFLTDDAADCNCNTGNYINVANFSMVNRRWIQLEWSELSFELKTGKTSPSLLAHH